MLSFYRRYRPHISSQLDLEKVRNFFADIINSGHFAHAYLFTGPRGSGKTSAARILAKIINCLDNQDAIKDGKGQLKEPDNSCSLCTRINTGSSLSVIELDAASNRGIDDIRSLRDKISLAPAEGSHTIYIIDEVHMLTTEAFNALLKTLEEPPAHSVFVLATTEDHKVPETIISRCVRLIFDKATSEEITRSLNRVVKGENITISPDSLALLANSVDGSFREGVKLLEQLVQKGKKISQASVEQILQHSQSSNPDIFIKYLLDKNLDKSLATLQKLNTSGTNFANFTSRLIEELRTRLLSLLTASDQKPHLVESYIDIIRRLIEAQIQIKSSPIPSLPLEIMVAEYCLSKNEVDSKPMEETTINMAISPPPTTESAPALAPAPFIPTGSPVSLKEISSKWQLVLTGVKPLNHSLEALLRASRPVDRDKNRVTVEVFYKFHKEQLEQARHRSQIEAVMSKLFNFPVALEFVLGQTKPAASPKTVENISGKLEDESLAAAAEEIFG